MDKVFDAAAKVSTGWSLAAFAIAGIVFIFFRKRGKLPRGAWIAIFAICILGIAPIYLHYRAVYRVRVIVLNPQHFPVEDARLVCSLGGEPKKVVGGWEFDIPIGTTPGDGRLTV